MDGRWKRLLILLSCVYATGAALEISNNNPHTPVQQTWEVQNGEGDIVWSTTAVRPPWTWWPDLTPDLCKLAAGSPAWDIPDHLDLLNAPPEKQCVQSPLAASDISGCSGQFYRANLRSAGIYICPGQGQHRKLRDQCGGRPDFYCAAWACETTGQAYWNPSSKWDLITVKRNSSHDEEKQGEREIGRYLKGCAVPSTNGPEGPCKDKYCNPILIKFTDKGK